MTRRFAPLWSTPITTPLAVMLAYLVFVFALGGGARADIASLALLRVGSIGVLGYAIAILDPDQLRANKGMVALAAGWAALTALHLVPLPPSVWHQLPGRELAIAIDAATGLEDKWRPISLVPHRTMNSLFSLTVPIAALMLALCLSREQLRLTAFALALLVFASALVSLLQIIGGPGNAFYLYRITNGDSAVGLFANRNHNAVFIAIGIASLGALCGLIKADPRAAQRLRMFAALAALSLVPFVIITQSRAGLALGVLSLGAAWWLQSSASHSKGTAKGALKPALLLGMAAVGATALAALTSLMTGDNAIARLMAGGHADDELRMRIWPRVIELAAEHFPVGSGMGTFVEVFEAGETSSTLGPSYINHAHNDFLELALTGGLPAAVLVVVALSWLILRGLRAFSDSNGADRTLRRLGVITVALILLACLYDYPLRTPSLATVSILALVWIAGRAPDSSPDASAARPLNRPARKTDPAARMAA
ncbi:hypothetical protein CD351_01740 [Erythrobacter sp. KY5]|uniref:O-antigen ligase family protein n=1 Tax=Erythrobacter sp. KY5 TaxID=2011159 RepID=UPI000DBEF695|nr:O-antigen ligase family protein [Erythrobacter sp. KY5]AWW73142.1 hypothetical protein CD351_01740 [Erythrobacter sp. KY5]